MEKNRYEELRDKLLKIKKEYDELLKQWQAANPNGTEPIEEELVSEIDPRIKTQTWQHKETGRITNLPVGVDMGEKWLKL